MNRTNQYRVLTALREVPDYKYDVLDIQVICDCPKKVAQDMEIVLNGDLYERFSHMTEDESVRLTTTILESLHQSMDGWSAGDKMVIELYLNDLMLALDSTS